MDDGLMNIHDFLGKIEWEGGVYGALEYGLSTKDYDLPKHLKDTWDEIRDLFNDLDDLVSDWHRESEKYAETAPWEDE